VRSIVLAHIAFADFETRSRGLKVHINDMAVTTVCLLHPKFLHHYEFMGEGLYIQSTRSDGIFSTLEQKQQG
jgi:hypothetical protein